MLVLNFNLTRQNDNTMKKRIKINNITCLFSVKVLCIVLFVTFSFAGGQMEADQTDTFQLPLASTESEDNIVNNVNINIETTTVPIKATLAGDVEAKVILLIKNETFFYNLLITKETNEQLFSVPRN